MTTTVTKRLGLINEVALYDETDRAVTYPFPDREDTEADWLSDQLQMAIDHPITESEGMGVYSFDIDLTLQLPKDTADEHGTVPIGYLRFLQTAGHIVGTCSDREPSNQRDTMWRLGFSPDFCIPKELLDITGKLLPGARLIHVGDDDARDKEIAERGGWAHYWPWEARRWAHFAAPDDHRRPDYGN